jgi:hypothetical protein
MLMSLECRASRICFSVLTLEIASSAPSSSIWVFRFGGISNSRWPACEPCRPRAHLLGRVDEVLPGVLQRPLRVLRCVALLRSTRRPARTGPAGSRDPSRWSRRVLPVVLDRLVRVVDRGLVVQRRVDALQRLRAVSLHRIGSSLQRLRLLLGSLGGVLDGAGQCVHRVERLNTAVRQTGELLSRSRGLVLEVTGLPGEHPHELLHVGRRGDGVDDRTGEVTEGCSPAA